MFSFRLLSRLALAALFLAWSFPYLQSRTHTLSLLIKNTPSSLPQINKFSTSTIKFPGALRNCEDALINGQDAFAILSCDPGRDMWNTVMGTFYHDVSKIPDGGLWVYHYARDEFENEGLIRVEIEGYEESYSFHPLGVEYHRESRTLFVCNHHVEGSRVDVFTLNVGDNKAVAKHKQSIIDPLLRTPNSVIALSEHEIYVTNDHYIRRKDYPALALIETYAGIPGGTVAYVNISEGVEVRTVARGPFVNGVTLLNETTVAVAISAAAEVRLYKKLEDQSLELVETIKTPFIADNLSTEKDGVLLIAGHPHPPSLDKNVHARRECIDDGVVPEQCWRSTAPSWVARWTQEKGLEDLYVSSSEFGSSTTAAKDVARNVGIVAGLYESGILVWKE